MHYRCKVNVLMVSEISYKKEKKTPNITILIPRPLFLGNSPPKPLHPPKTTPNRITSNPLHSSSHTRTHRYIASSNRRHLYSK